MKTPFELKPGAYAMHHMHNRGSGTLVLVDYETSPGRWSLRYIPTGGGSSSWPTEEFRPVTDPVLIAVAKADLARREEAKASASAEKFRLEAEKWDGVAACLAESNELATPPATA